MIPGNKNQTIRQSVSWQGAAMRNRADSSGSGSRVSFSLGDMENRSQYIKRSHSDSPSHSRSPQRDGAGSSDSGVVVTPDNQEPHTSNRGGYNTSNYRGRGKEHHRGSRGRGYNSFKGHQNQMYRN